MPELFNNDVNPNQSPSILKKDLPYLHIHLIQVNLWKKNQNPLFDLPMFDIDLITYWVLENK